MADRDVVGSWRRDGQAKADDPGCQPLQAVGLQIEADPFCIVEFPHEFGQSGFVAHDRHLGGPPCSIAAAGRFGQFGRVQRHRQSLG